MKKSTKMLLVCYGVLLLYIIAGWVYGAEVTALCLLFVAAMLESGPAAAILPALAALLLYIWIAAAFWCVSRRKRFGTVSVVIFVTMEIAAHIVCTFISWWYLLAIAADLFLGVLAYRLYRASAAET